MQYEASTGETLESMEPFQGALAFPARRRVPRLKAYGTEPWFSWARVEDLLTRSIAEF